MKRMKWDSLNYKQQNKLKELYNERHREKLPASPGEFTPPAQQDRRIIRTARATDVYVRMENAYSHGNHSSGEPKASLRLVGGTEHIDLELPIEMLPHIIEELQKLQADMLAQTDSLTDYLARYKAYQKAQADFEEQREYALTKALAKGEFTEDQIRTSPDKIPF